MPITTAFPFVTTGSQWPDYTGRTQVDGSGFANCTRITLDMSGYSYVPDVGCAKDVSGDFKSVQFHGDCGGSLRRACTGQPRQSPGTEGNGNTAPIPK